MSLPASRCPACHRTALPGEPVCLACTHPTEATELAPVGTVLARTRYPGGPWIALIELEDQARVLARCQAERLSVGSRGNLQATADGFTFSPG